MATREELLKEIEAYLEATGLAASALGSMAMSDPAFVFKLRNGRNVRVDTADRIRQYMRDHKPARKGKRDADPRPLALTA